MALVTWREYQRGFNELSKFSKKLLFIIYIDPNPNRAFECIYIMKESFFSINT